ncbi:MAG: P-loop ATPase protein family protein [Candidatus Methanolliviera sp. GoM_asphalt]|nr:MAG: P-loop ATPase protein family protein [Candidatus Methanolliviera sp. GoM_asphalt]
MPELIRPLGAVNAHKQQIQLAIAIDVGNGSTTTGIFIANIRGFYGGTPTGGIAICIKVPANHIPELICTFGVVNAHQEQVELIIAIDVGNCSSTTGIFIANFGGVNGGTPTGGIAICIKVPANHIPELIRTFGVVNAHQEQVELTIAIDVRNGSTATGIFIANFGRVYGGTPTGGIAICIKVPANHIPELICSFRVVNAHKEQIRLIIAIDVRNCSTTTTIIIIANFGRVYGGTPGQITLVYLVIHHPDEPGVCGKIQRFIRCGVEHPGIKGYRGSIILDWRKGNVCLISKVPAYHIPEVVCAFRVVNAHQQQVLQSVAVDVCNGSSTTGIIIANSGGFYGGTPTGGLAICIKVPTYQIPELICTLGVVNTHKKQIQLAIAIDVRNCSTTTCIFIANIRGFYGGTPTGGLAICIKVPTYQIPELICTLWVVNTHKKQIQLAIAIDVGNCSSTTGIFIANFGGVYGGTPTGGIAVCINVPAYQIPELICTFEVVNAHKKQIQFAVAIDVRNGNSTTCIFIANSGGFFDRTPTGGIAVCINVPTYQIPELICTLWVVNAHKKQILLAIAIDVRNGNSTTGIFIANSGGFFDRTPTGGIAAGFGNNNTVILHRRLVWNLICG